MQPGELIGSCDDHSSQLIPHHLHPSPVFTAERHTVQSSSPICLPLLFQSPGLLPTMSRVSPHSPQKGTKGTAPVGLFRLDLSEAFCVLNPSSCHHSLDILHVPAGLLKCKYKCPSKVLSQPAFSPPWGLLSPGDVSVLQLPCSAQAPSPIPPAGSSDTLLPLLLAANTLPGKPFHHQCSPGAHSGNSLNSFQVKVSHKD